MPLRRNRRHFKSDRRNELKKIASAHISRLLELALSQNKIHPQIAEIQAASAWQLSTRTNARLGSMRFLFCHKCKKFIAPPRLARYRLSKKRKSLNITCLYCGSTYRRVFGART